MAGKRYQYRTTFKNESENYESLFRKRSVESIQQYDTAKFSYPTDGVETPFRVNQFNAFVA